MHTLRPPDYFPGLPFWALAVHCEQVVVADTFEYSRQSFQNRARLRTPDGWQWITIPLKGGQRGRPIAEAEIDNTVPWRGKHLRSLQYNYRTSPYFEAFEDRFEAFYDRDWATLGSVSVASVRLVCDLLELPGPVVLSEQGKLDPESPELILESDRPLEGASVLAFDPEVYHQNFAGFEPGMSVLDALFNVGFETLDLIGQGISIRFVGRG
jgi:hypothetical protein